MLFWLLANTEEARVASPGARTFGVSARTWGSNRMFFCCGTASSMFVRGRIAVTVQATQPG